MKHHGLALFLFHALLVPATLHASGQPDTSFSDEGTMVVHVDRIQPSGDESLGTGLIDHAGRYVSFGTATYKPDEYINISEEFTGNSGLITRHLPSGALDNTFGIDGVMHLETYGYYLTWQSAVELPDGKFFVVGNRQHWLSPPSSLSPLVCRINENGSLDTTFSTQGCRALDYPKQMDMALDLEVMVDGRIAVLGTAAGGTTQFAVWRLLPSGQDDLCFGDASCQSGGMVFGPASLEDAFARDMTIAASGEITLIGRLPIEGEPNDPNNIADTDTSIALRLTPNGSVDPTFGIGGVRRIDYSPLFPQDLITQDVSSILPDTDGGVVVTSAIYLNTSSEESIIGVAKLDQHGTLDAGFADAGLGTFRFDQTSWRQIPIAATRQSDGKLLISGYVQDDNMQAPSVLRLSADGVLDVHFGNAGAVTIPVLAGQFWMYPVAVAVSGERVVLFGNSAMDVQDANPTLIALDRDALFGDAFETAD